MRGCSPGGPNQAERPHNCNCIHAWPRTHTWQQPPAHARHNARHRTRGAATCRSPHAAEELSEVRAWRTRTRAEVQPCSCCSRRLCGRASEGLRRRRVLTRAGWSRQGLRVCDAWGTKEHYKEHRERDGRDGKATQPRKHSGEPCAQGSWVASAHGGNRRWRGAGLEPEKGRPGAGPWQMRRRHQWPGHGSKRTGGFTATSALFGFIRRGGRGKCNQGVFTKVGTASGRTGCSPGWMRGRGTPSSERRGEARHGRSKELTRPGGGVEAAVLPRPSPAGNREGRAIVSAYVHGHKIATAYVHGHAHIHGSTHQPTRVISCLLYTSRRG